jgi:peptidyl-prolyl cis-trans isomerase SurA
MKHLRLTAALASAILLSCLTATAQENDVKVVDEVVAVVNDGVITLSGIKRELKGLIDQKVQEGMKREDAEKLFADKQGELIAGLINEELIMQKGKELGVEKDVEASLNSRFLQIMKQQGFKTLESLFEAMRKEGVSPDEIREIWRKQATREEVIRREVQIKLYWDPTPTRLKEYFEANKAKFTKPETVTLSEIFLNFAGQNPDTVKAKAKQLVTQLRGGADFVKTAMENSESPDVAQSKGSLGTVAVPDLEKQYPAYATAIKGLKAGDIAEPFSDDIGIHIIRVDQRTAASSESTFDEDAVRRAIMEASYPDALKKYMTKLREDAYIKISETYRPIVSPLLFADDRAEKTVKNEKTDQTSKESSADKSPKKPKSQKKN